MPENLSHQGNRVSSRYVPLRFRFILISSCLLIILLGSIAFLTSIQQSRSIRAQAERRGLAMARSLAATSAVALATYNYIALEQCANRAITDSETIYVIIHDKEGRVAGYSARPDLQGKILDDAVSRKALSSMEPIAQVASSMVEGIQVMDVAIPVFLPGSEMRWGTVRVGLSLEMMQDQIRQTQMIIVGTGFLALVFGIFVSSWAARRITRPLGQLMHATVEAAQGNLNQEIDVITGDEVEVLAANFRTMIREILAQREQLEHQLVEIMHLQRYTEKLLATMKDGLISMDMEGRLVTINPAASEMLRLSGDAQKGRYVKELLEGIPPLKNYLEELLSSPVRARMQEQFFVEREEESQILLANSSLLMDPVGTTLEVITNLHDITELKKLELRMRQTERLAALGTLAAGMAHEIRNPLSAIKTFVQLLPRKLEKPGFLDKFHRTVPRELDRINRLIEDLLELSRSPKYHFRTVDIRRMVEDTVELFEEELRSWRITHHIRFDPNVPAVRADVDQLTKAFQNLIRNAVQAMPEGGEIWIEASGVKTCPPGEEGSNRQNGWMTIVFKDTGYGISGENLKTIFNPFFTTKDTGTGLGLAITHKVIVEHGGHIDVKSRPGEGSCFTIYLPAECDGSS